MNCSQCGADVVAEALFCQKCGERLSDTEPQGDSSAGRGRGKSPADVTEQVIWEGTFSPKAMIGSWIVATIFSVALLVGFFWMLITRNDYWWVPILAAGLLDIFLLLKLFYNQFSVRYRLTNQRFFHEQGLLSRTVNPIDLILINDVAYEQGLIDRMLGVGRVKIMSTDTSDPELWLNGIDNVQHVATLIDKARREETVRRRVFIEKQG